MLFFDPRYLLFMIPGLIVMGLAQWKLRSAFGKYREIPNSRRLMGAQVAELVMRSAGVHDVGIEPIPGELTDHFDPRAKVLRLSEPVYSSTSLAAMAVAAHEAGHAVQQHVGYGPLVVRTGLVPLVNIGSSLGWIAILAGLFLQFTGLAWIGVILFASATLFALVTLPVEFDATRRAKQSLAAAGLVDVQEGQGVAKVLDAAAWTYIAGFAASLLTLLYYVMLVFGGRRDE